MYENPEQGAKGWEDMSPPFDKYSAMHVVHAGRSGDNGDDRDIYDFFVNADNIYLKSEMKPKDQDSEVVSARFIYGMVLLGLALLQEEKKSEEQTSGDIMNGHVGEDDTPSIEDKVESFSKAVAPVLLPMIDYLGALEAPPIGWQLFVLGCSRSDCGAFVSSLVTYATRLLAEALRP